LRKSADCNDHDGQKNELYNASDDQSDAFFCGSLQAIKLMDFKKMGNEDNEMLILDIRLQIVTLCFFIVIFSDYLKNKKLSLLSNKCFSMMLYFTAVNLLFDVIRVYTIIYMDMVSPMINRICNQIFYGTFIMIVVSLYWYVEILAHNQKRMKSKRGALSMIPLAFSMIMILFGELNYSTDANRAYAYGSMAISFLIATLFYSFLIIKDTYVYKDIIKNRMAIRLGSMTLFVGAVIQFFTHGLLLSRVVVTLMILFIYLSFENPKEYLDEDTGAFNKRAFHLMLEEKKAAEKPLLLVSVVVDDLDRIQTMMGHDNANHVLAIIGDRMKETFLTSIHHQGNRIKETFLSNFLNKSTIIKDTFHAYMHEKVDLMHISFHSNVQQQGNMIKNTFLSSVYHTRSNVITFLTENSLEAIQNELDQMALIIKEPITFSQYTIGINAHIDIISTDFYKDLDSCDEVYEMMNYMARHNEALSDASIHMLNEKISNQKLRYTTIENILREAIEKSAFEVIYQPIFNPETGQFLSAEALVRLTDTTTVGFISPEEFIPIAERKGMIMELGRIVFEKVCEFSREKRLSEMGIAYIEVNLSVIQCVHPDLPHQLEQIMKKYEISPGFINLEITETAFVESGEMLQVNMLKLRKMGFHFSMDDFGTGYSNLSRMTEVDYDLVKIDKSLIWPCFYYESQKANAILENVIQMLLQLNLKIVAEGVETEEMATYLNNHGVTYLQGYYYSKPLNEEAYIVFLNEKSA